MELEEPWEVEDLGALLEVESSGAAELTSVKV